MRREGRREGGGKEERGMKVGGERRRKGGERGMKGGREGGGEEESFYSTAGVPGWTLDPSLSFSA